MNNIGLNDVRVYVEMERFRIQLIALGWTDRQWERLLMHADRDSQVSLHDVWFTMTKALTLASFGDMWRDDEDFDGWRKRVLLLWQSDSVASKMSSIGLKMDKV